MDFKWKDPKPLAGFFVSSYTARHVLDIVFIPGSNFLVASTKHARGSQYSLEIVSVDKPELSAAFTSEGIKSQGSVYGLEWRGW